MKKKVLLIVLFSLLALFGGYVLVSFIVNKDGTMYWINQVIDWLNKPLPIIGVTTLALLIFVWKVVISTNYGKARLAAYEQKVREIENEKELFIKDANNELTKLKNENSVLRKQLADICYMSTNKKIKDYGKGLENYGKETTND